MDVIFGYDFFVSYTWADGSKYAHSLHEKLKAQGFTVFLDEEDYARGDNWTLLGRRALKKTRQLILVATPKVHASGPVLKELTAFESTGRRIIPIEIGDSLDRQKYPKSPLLPLHSCGASENQSGVSTRCNSERSSARSYPRIAARFSACSAGSNSCQSSSWRLPSVVRPSVDCRLAGDHRESTAERSESPETRGRKSGNQSKEHICAGRF